MAWLRIRGAAGIFALGAITAELSHNIVMLVTGRIIVGIGIGLASFTVPLYISEVAPKEQRGWMVSLNQLVATIGILIAYAVDFGFSASGQWGWMLRLGVVPAIALPAHPLTAEEKAAYDAPYPSFIYKAAPRTFPSMGGGDRGGVRSV